jgi:hypothetical protein
MREVRALQRVRVMPSPPASREEILELVGEVDDSFIDRIHDTGASIDEIAEAMDALTGRFSAQAYIASSTPVVVVQAILEELFESEDLDPNTFPIRGVPLGHVQ